MPKLFLKFLAIFESPGSQNKCFLLFAKLNWTLSLLTENSSVAARHTTAMGLNGWSEKMVLWSNSLGKLLAMYNTS